MWSSRGEESHKKGRQAGNQKKSASCGPQGKKNLVYGARKRLHQDSGQRIHGGMTQGNVSTGISGREFLVECQQERISDGRTRLQKSGNHDSRGCPGTRNSIRDFRGAGPASHPRHSLSLCHAHRQPRRHHRPGAPHAARSGPDRRRGHPQHAAPAQSFWHQKAAHELPRVQQVRQSRRADQQIKERRHDRACDRRRDACYFRPGRNSGKALRTVSRAGDFAAGRKCLHHRPHPLRQVDQEIRVRGLSAVRQEGIERNSCGA